jgi:monoamine oxidase
MPIAVVINLWWAGYGKIPGLLANGLSIEYGVVVNKITWGNNGVTVTAGTKSWSARAVIVTIPLGVLKAGKVTFSPALPTKYTQAIGQLAMGVLDRCVLRFSAPFWGSDYSTFTLAGSDPHLWYQFIPLNEPLGIPALVAFNAGSKALALEAKTDAQIVAEMTQVVQKAFGTKATSTGAMVTRWGKDPYALGAYSYVPLGGSFGARKTLGHAGE